MASLVSYKFDFLFIKRNISARRMNEKLIFNCHHIRSTNRELCVYTK